MVLNVAADRDTLQMSVVVHPTHFKIMRSNKDPLKYTYELRFLVCGDLASFETQLKDQLAPYLAKRAAEQRSKSTKVKAEAATKQASEIKRLERKRLGTALDSGRSNALTTQEKRALGISSALTTSIEGITLGGGPSIIDTIERIASNSTPTPEARKASAKDLLNQTLENSADLSRRNLRNTEQHQVDQIVDTLK
jgi:hypothetical protein